MQMKEHGKRRSFWLTLGVVLTTGATAWTEESKDEKFPVSFGMDTVTRYVFRGFDAGGEANAFSVQPNIGIKLSDRWEAGIWASVRLEEGTKVDEVDYTLQHKRPAPAGAQLRIGYTLYDYQQPGRKNSQEVYAGLGWPKLPFNPTFTVYQDFKAGSGTYAEFTAIEEVKLFGAKLRAGAGIGYNHGQYVPANGFSDIGAVVQMDIPIGGGWTLSPSLNYVVVPKDEVNEDNEFYLAIGLKQGLGRSAPLGGKGLFNRRLGGRPE